VSCRFLALIPFAQYFLVDLTNRSQRQLLDDHNPLRHRELRDDAFVHIGCSFRKSYPCVAMMQAGQNRHSDNSSVSLNRSTQRRILAQR